MILVLKQDITEEEKSNLIENLRAENCIIKSIEGVEETILGVVGKIARDLRHYETMTGVAKVIPISKPYKLVSRELHPEPTVVKVGDVEIGGDRLVMIAGPCGVEERTRTLEIARAVRKHGAVLFRGGAYKPRTSPYSFQGLEEEGLKILAEVREKTGLGVVTEMTSPSQADLMVKYVDMVQVGARNMQNFELLKTVGRMGKPVLLKRGMSATIQDWLMAAEYVLSEGNDQVVLCERGIRTFENYTRNTLDLTVIPVIKQLSHLPIIIDPSHATGLRDKVCPVGRAAVAAGADGLIVEVHTDPDKALSDGPQSLYPEQFEQLTRDLFVIAPVVGKQMDFGYLAKAQAFRQARAEKGAPPVQAVYHGAPGTLSYKACHSYFGGLEPESRASIREVLEAVRTGQAAFGVLPLENSIAGSRHENYDLLKEFDLKIVGEVSLRDVHNLVGWEGTSLADIKRVFGHPQVFEQCQAFLDQHPDWDLVASVNTASNVARLKESGDRAAAAISTREAAELFDMSLLKEGIESSPRNFTRFVVMAKEEVTDQPADKTSVILAVADEPGALFRVMGVFADNRVNIVKLESRPMPDRSWEYMFYLDFEMDSRTEAYRNVLKEIRARSAYFKNLGAYPKGGPAAN